MITISGGLWNCESTKRNTRVESVMTSPLQNDGCFTNHLHFFTDNITWCLPLSACETGPAGKHSLLPSWSACHMAACGCLNRLASVDCGRKCVCLIFKPDCIDQLCVLKISEWMCEEMRTKLRVFRGLHVFCFSSYFGCLTGPEDEVQNGSRAGMSSCTHDFSGRLTLTGAVLSTHTVLMSDTTQLRYFTALWKRPQRKRLVHIPHCDCVSSARGKVYIMPTFCMVIGDKFNAQIVNFYCPTHGWFLNFQTCMVCFRESLLRISINSERTGCPISRFSVQDFSLFLRQHRECPHNAAPR